MYKVLHVMDAADGGISAVVLNYYRHMDRSRIHFDIVSTNTEVGYNVSQLRLMGAEIFFVPPKSRGFEIYKKKLCEILSSGNYDAIHVHESQTSYVALKIAKKLGIKIRIAHSHTTSPDISLKDKLRRFSGILLNIKYSTAIVACGKLAGTRVFGSKNMKRNCAYILPNAIETSNFMFNASKREEIRSGLRINDRFAVGMVGRLSGQKNHIFALKMIKEVRTIIPCSILIIVGSGSEEGAIRRFIEDNELSDCTLLLGSREDVAELYMGMDVAVLPSLYEGFPVVGIEAAASGLPLVMSDRITDELKFYKGASYISLDSPDEWVGELRNIYRSYLSRDRAEAGKEVCSAGYDIKETATILEKIYGVDNKRG